MHPVYNIEMWPVTRATLGSPRYALGRDLEYYDRPVVRAIVRDAEAGGYRWSSIILGIVESPQFLTRARRTAEAAGQSM